jgi:hypothetical protein
LQYVAIYDNIYEEVIIMKDSQIRILIEKDLKIKFKNFCNDNDKNMSKVITRLIKEYMERSINNEKVYK